MVKKNFSRWHSQFVFTCSYKTKWLATGQWFSLGTLISSTKKTDCQDITEILLKMALNTITKPNNIKPGIHDASFASKSPFKILEFKFFDRVYHTRNLNQKTWTDLDGIEMHPIFLQLGWNLDGNWPIRRQNPYQHQFVKD